MKHSILHLITGLSTGGAEAMLYKLLSRMDRARFKIVVVSMTDRGTFGARIEALGIPVVTLGLRRGLPNPIGFWRLVRLLRLEKPHVLQTWMYHADLLGLIAGRLTNLPRIAWNLRCSNMEMRHYSWLSALLIRLLAVLSGFPDAVLVNSEAGRKFHETLNYHPKRWEVIPNGFDLEIFRPSPEARLRFRAEIGIPEDAFLIGLIARDDPMKDHQTFLQAAGYLLKNHPNIHFILVGRGIDEGNQRLMSLIESLGILKQTHLLGERSDVANIVPALDIASSASSFGEGFPNVIGEAMACGVPCVVTDVGDSAIIVGDTGKVVPPKNPEALAVAWSDLIMIGSEHRRQLGLAARQRIEENYSLPAIVAKYESLYQELVSNVRS